MRVKGPDRISDLPIQIREIVLSKLDAKEACRTSFISKEWEKSWKETNNIKFDIGYIGDIGCADIFFKKIGCADIRHFKIESLVKVLSHILENGSFHRIGLIDEIRVRCPYSIEFRKEIESWMPIFSTLSVRDLRVDLRHTRPNMDIIQFPSQKMTKNFCQSLCKLCIKGINVNGNMLNMLLDKCPLLEEVCVVGAVSLISFTRTTPCPRLKKISITSPVTTVIIYKSEQLKSIKLDSTSKDEYRAVTFDIKCTADDMFLGRRFLTYFLRYCRRDFNLKSLYDNLKSLTIMMHDEWETAVVLMPTMRSLELLCVQTWSHVYVSRRCCELIKKAPNLKSFVFQAGWAKRMVDCKPGNVTCSWTSEVAHEKLEDVSILGYYGSLRDDHNMIYFFLDSGRQHRLLIKIDPRNQNSIFDDPESDPRIEYTDGKESMVAGRERAFRFIKQLKIPDKIEFQIM